MRETVVPNIPLSQKKKKKNEQFISQKEMKPTTPPYMHTYHANISLKYTSYLTSSILRANPE